MNFDLRFPLGLFFGINGLLLTGYGLLSKPEVYERSLGININLIWGIVLIAFGLLMLGLAWKGRRDSGK